MSHINACIDKENSTNDSLVIRLLKATAVDIYADKSVPVEDRRIRWTTNTNLKTLFNNWSRDLIELGFATADKMGHAVIPEEQLNNIVNIDKTCLSLDGSQGNQGGRPEVSFYDPNLPRVGKSTSKSAKTTTMITGSTTLAKQYCPTSSSRQRPSQKTTCASVMTCCSGSLTLLGSLDVKKRNNGPAPLA